MPTAWLRYLLLACPALFAAEVALDAYTQQGNMSAILKLRCLQHDACNVMHDVFNAR